MKPVLYMTSSLSGGMIQAILEQEGISYSTEIGVPQLAKLTNGRFHTGGDRALVVEGEIIRDIYHLCRWIEANGLRRL